jgi:hypothetical protein
MRTRILLAVALTIAVAGAAVGALGLVKANSTGDQLRETRATVKTLEGRVSDLAGAAAQDTTAPSLTTLDDRITALRQDVAAIVRACPERIVNAYYQRLLGESQAGSDTSAAIELLTDICPNITEP